MSAIEPTQSTAHDVQLAPRAFIALALAEHLNRLHGVTFEMCQEQMCQRAIEIALALEKERQEKCGL